MNMVKTALPGVLIIEPKVFGDARGFFLETWQQKRYQDIGIPGPFVQDNLSFSTHGVLRGLHYQHTSAQGKLVFVLQGEVFDVAVDVRRGSPTFGQWAGVTLSGDNRRQFWVPAGFAHGFCVVSETAYFAYKCTEIYDPQGEVGLAWDDQDINITWPLKEVSLSDKDQQSLCLKDIPMNRLPLYKL